MAKGKPAAAGKKKAAPGKATVRTFPAQANIDWPYKMYDPQGERSMTDLQDYTQQKGRRSFNRTNCTCSRNTFQIRTESILLTTRKQHKHERKRGKPPRQALHLFDLTRAMLVKLPMWSSNAEKQKRYCCENSS